MRFALGLAIVGAVAAMALVHRHSARGPSDAKATPTMPVPPTAQTRPIHSPPDISPPIVTPASRRATEPVDTPDANGSPPSVRTVFGNRIAAVSYLPDATVVLSDGARYRRGDRLPSGAVLRAIDPDRITVLVDDAEVMLRLSPHDSRRVPLRP